MKAFRVLSDKISTKARKEVFRFLFVGGIAVLIDASAYAMLQHQGISPSWAKRISFIIGSIWAFVMNKFYTFEQKKLRVSEPFVFAIVYVIGCLLNSLCHDLILALTGIKAQAFLIATAVSTCTNFMGQKWLVFRGAKKAAC